MKSGTKLGAWVGLVCLGLGFTGAAQARDWATIQKSGTIKFATEGAFAPFNFFQGTKLTGFEVDLAADVAKKLGLKIEWVTQPFDSLLIGLGQDRYDVVIASHGITDERLKAVDFTAPHYCTGGVVVAKTSGPKSRNDLKGKIVAVQLGTTYATDVQKMSGLKEAKLYPKDPDAYQSLVAGRVDAWVTDRFLALETTKKNPKDAIQVGELLFVEKVGMALKKGNASLKTALNQGLADLQKDGSYKKLSLQYFGQDIRCE